LQFIPANPYLAKIFDSWSLFCAHSEASCCAIGGTLVVHSLRLTPYIASHCTPLAALIAHLECLSVSPCLFASLKTKPSARLSHFWTVSFTYLSSCQQFCETSSFSDVEDTKNERILREFLQKGKLSAGLTASYQCVLRFSHSTFPKYGAFDRKLMPRYTKHCTCPAKLF
jgi:hypothetical protein